MFIIGPYGWADDLVNVHNRAPTKRLNMLKCKMHINLTELSVVDVMCSVNQPKYGGILYFYHYNDATSGGRTAPAFS
jgi:hypothetical protein